MKKNKLIFIIIIAFLCFAPGRAYAVTFDWKAAANTTTASGNSGDYTKSTITRGGAYGIRISLCKKKNENNYECYKQIDKEVDANSQITIAKNKYTIDSSFANVNYSGIKTYIKDVEKELTQLDDYADRYGTWEEFLQALKKTKTYATLIELDPKLTINELCIDKNKSGCLKNIDKTTKINDYYTMGDYRDEIKKLYITIEPMIKVSIPSKDIVDLGYKFDNNQIQATKDLMNKYGKFSIGEINTYTNIIIGLKGWTASSRPIMYEYSESSQVFSQVCSNPQNNCSAETLKFEREKMIDIMIYGGTCDSKDECFKKFWSLYNYTPFSNSLESDWNTVYEVFNDLKYSTSIYTVKDLKKFLYSSDYNKKLACITNRDADRCSSSGGSIGNNSSKISCLIVNDKEKIGQWEKIPNGKCNDSTNGATWDEITDVSGYGIGIIWLRFNNLDDFSSYCRLENDKLIGEDGKENLECCAEYDDKNKPLWPSGEYNKFKFKNGKSGELSDLYKKYCTSPCTIEHYKALKELSNSIIIEDNKIKSFDIALNISPLKCCNYDEYESDVLKGITKNEFNSNVAKACNFCNKDINSATKLSDVMYNIPNTKESLNCCYWENFGLSDDKRKENSGLSKTKFNNAVKNKKFCQDYCTFDKSLGKGERYYNGLDCCKWTNYGKAGDAEETRKLRIQNAGNRTMTELKNTEEYKLICPTTNDFCEFDYDNNKLILNGNETNDCCESPDLWKSQTEYDKFRKYDNGKYYNQFCKTEKNYCTALKIRDENRLECCDDLSQYSESIQQTIKINYGSLENYLKTEYNQIYYQYCPTNDGGCNPHIESSCPNCDTNHNGLTYDSVKNIDSTDLNISDEAKKCIFDNDDYEYEELSNKYCSIYCTQKIEYNYPSKIMPTGGRYITVGENGSFSPIKNITSMTCRISKVDTKTFEKDLKNAEKELKDAYNEYSKNAEPIENKEEIINTENGSEKLNNVAENVCDCKNNVTGLSSKDNKCCESTANETLSGSQVSFVKKIYAQVKDAKEKPAPSDKNSCNSANGSWITTKEEPYSSYDVSAGSLSACATACGGKPNREKFTAYCKDGYEAGSKPQCESHGGMISSICTCKGGTNTVKLDNPYCANYRKQYYCEDGYTLRGTKCIPDMPSNLECERDSADNVKCNYYSCDSTINVGSEKGYLSSSKEGYVSQKDAKCTYKYCKTRNYLKYDYQTYNKYSYGESKKLTQKANNVKTCSNNDDYYETVFKRQKQIALQNLMAAEKKYNEIVKNYKSCFSIDEKMGDYLNYDIKVKLDYNNAGIYTVNQELKRTETNSTDQDYIKIKKDYEIAYLDYGNNYEFKTKKQEFMIFENMNRINSVKKTKTYNYKLSSDTYLYVGKDSWSKTSSEINSIYIGNHLPVAYNPHNDSETTLTLTTTYDEGKIKNSSFANALCKDEYMCKLTVNDNSGCIIPVYRPISLKDPFPDQDGTGRQTGINWCYGNNCANTNETVKSVITNNRTVKEDSVYNLIPLYTITLKPGDIKEIRNYNATTTYGDYDLLCENNTGKFCKSRFLRGNSVALEGEKGRYNISHLINQNRSCALNESLQGCIPGDYYDTGGGN